MREKERLYQYKPKKGKQSLSQAMKKVRNSLPAFHMKRKLAIQNLTTEFQVLYKKNSITSQILGYLILKKRYLNITIVKK